MTAGLRSGRVLVCLVLVLGGTACGGPPPPASLDTPRSLEPSGVSTPEPSHSSAPSGGTSVTDSVWYEIDRVGDTEGNGRRSLLFGSLGGEFRPQILIAEDSAADGNPESEPFRWIDPQADGIFSGHVVMWGRDGEFGRIESVDLDDGALETLMTTDGIVHVATADDSLSRLFFITVDGASLLPTGLWASRVGAPDPVALTYPFAPQVVSSRFTYRLVANREGSFLAVQAMEGPVSIVDVDRDVATSVEPGGPVVGFAEDSLVAYGPPSETGSRPLVAIDLGTLDEQIIADAISSAQVVPGTSGDLVAAMRISEDDPRGYEIEAIDLSTGASSIVYSHQDEAIGPLLARRDRSYLGYALPPDWILLVDSFMPFVSDPSIPPKDPPESTYPLAVNLRTGESMRLGPFLGDTPS